VALDRRGDFALPDEVTYLNSAFMSPLPRVAADAGVAGMLRKTRPWEVVPEDFFAGPDEARRLLGALLGLDPEGVAVVPAASYGIAQAAAELPLAAGRTVVVLAEQFPSNVYEWRDRARGAGAEVVTVPRRDEGWTAGLLDAIDARTAVVAVPQCHWTDGGLVDLLAVGAAAREVGAALVLDVSQSAGVLALEADAVQPDFVVTVGYKWLLGPYSVSFLWAAPHRRDGDPIEENWIDRAGSEDFAGLVDYVDDYRPGARRYDVGEAGNLALMPAATAALRYLLDLGGAAPVAEHCRALSDRLVAGATSLGLSVAPAEQRSPHLTGVRLGGADPAMVAARLAAARVYVSVRGDSVRVSTHLYNTAADVDRFLDVLGDALG
jgi:selenocysteine lyase/cysteine desulfurase